MMRLLRLVVLLAVFAFVAGFAVFAERATRGGPPSPAPQADGVVALTGAGGARLSTAMSLLEQGAGARLLITGVNPTTTDDDVRRLVESATATFDCCVDIDRNARTTVDNAREAAAWAREHDYDSLIVVTSDFHMPRSILELRHAFAEDAVTLHAYPVRGTEVNGIPWWRDFAAARRLFVEYLKYIAVAVLNLSGLRPAPGDA